MKSFPPALFKVHGHCRTAFGGAGESLGKYLFSGIAQITRARRMEIQIMCDGCRDTSAIDLQIAFLESLIQRNSVKQAPESDALLLRARETLDRLYQEKQIENHP